MDYRQTIIQLINDFASGNEGGVRSTLSNKIRLKVDCELSDGRRASDKIIKSMTKMDKNQSHQMTRLENFTAEGRKEAFFANFTVRYLIYAEDTVSEEYVEITMFFNEGLIDYIFVVVPQSGTRTHCIKTNEKSVYKNEHEIYYVESRDKKLLFHCKRGTYEERGQLRKRSPQFSKRFVEARYSHLVNMDHILEVRFHEIRLHCGEKIIIPPTRFSAVQETIRAWKQLDLNKLIHSNQE